MHERRRGRIYVTLAAVAWSTAGLLQRELTVNTAGQLAGRAFFAIAGLLAFIAFAERGGVVRSFRAVGRAGLGITALMAISSGAFLVALNHASVASVLFMQALSPIIAALIGHALGEPVPRRTWLAMAIAIGGVTLMVGGPGRPSAVGLSLSLLMSFAFAGTIVITRHRRDVSMAPATCLSQVVVFALAAPFASYGAIGPEDWLLLVLLGVTQIGLGLIFLTIGGRLIPAAEVALITLLEIVLGPLWVWVFLSEQPSTATLAGGVIVLGAVLVQVGRQRGDGDDRQRLAALLPDAEIVLTGSASVPGFDAADVDLVALVPDVAVAARALRSSYAPLYEDEWRDDWAAFRVAGPPQVDIVLTTRGSRGDLHHRRAWELLRGDTELLAEYASLKHDPAAKRAFFERVVASLEA